MPRAKPLFITIPKPGLNLGLVDLIQTGLIGNALGAVSVYPIWF